MIRYSQGKTHALKGTDRQVAAAVTSENGSYKKKRGCAGRQDDVVFGAEINRSRKPRESIELVALTSNTSGLLGGLKQNNLVGMHRQVLEFG